MSRKQTRVTRERIPKPDLVRLLRDENTMLQRELARVIDGYDKQSSIIKQYQEQGHVTILLNDNLPANDMYVTVNEANRRIAEFARIFQESIIPDTLIYAGMLSRLDSLLHRFDQCVTDRGAGYLCQLKILQSTIYTQYSDIAGYIGDEANIQEIKRPVFDRLAAYNRLIDGDSRAYDDLLKLARDSVTGAAMVSTVENIQRGKAGDIGKAYAVNEAQHRHETTGDSWQDIAISLLAEWKNAPQDSPQFLAYQWLEGIKRNKYGKLGRRLGQEVSRLKQKHVTKPVL